LNTRLTTAAILAAAIATPAFAQSFTVVVGEDDVVPGVGAVDTITGISVNNLGQFVVEANTDNTDTDIDEVLLLDGITNVIAREGDPVAGTGVGGPPLLGSVGDFDLTNTGSVAANFFLDNTTGSGDNSGIYFGSGPFNQVLQESDAVTAPGAPAGSTYIGFFAPKVAAGGIYASVSIDDPAVSGLVRGLVRFDQTTSAQTIVAIENETLPFLGGELINDIETSIDETDVNNAGNVLFGANVGTDVGRDSLIYLTGTGVIAREGDASPVAGLDFNSLAGAEVALGDGGDVAFTADIGDDSSVDGAIFLNGSLFAREGDAAPGLPGRTFGSNILNSNLRLDAAGNLLFLSDLDGSSSEDGVLYYNDTPLLVEGVSQIAGRTVEQLLSADGNLAFSDDGSFAIVEVVLEDSINAAVLIAIPEPATAGLLGVAGLTLLRRRRA
jgi:hypothetical protein